MKNKYYSLNKILSLEAIYNVIIGERSNGKTYACLKYALEKWLKNKEMFAYVRRWKDDAKPTQLKKLYSSMDIKTITKGKYDCIDYYNNCFWLCVKNIEKEVIERKEIIGYRFILADNEEYKSYQYPTITTIIFDEILTRDSYIVDEFIEFENLISTIVRDRNNVKIFMLGNTINKYCPYFNEMGLTNVKNQKPGTIDFYTYGNSQTTCAVEYCESRKDVESKITKSKYFGFNNPKLKMITEGAWELDVYPHLPVKYSPQNVCFSFYIQFDGDTLKADIISINDLFFMFIHRHTKELLHDENDIIFKQEYDVNPLHHRNILRCNTRYGDIIKNLFINHKVFYQSNEIGEIVRNYLYWCEDL